ncbi:MULTISPECIES: fimbrial protein [unclassified Escherichia]|uniref:fimbrial protein n=1 Tax=unclassified Escherichia TaxID=2608889 RepID=UPI00107F8AC5|nr:MULTISPECIES: fimbrial protein [unclassified Escherichia]TGC20552.1 fimbrial protein [Escherichia sp. E2562]TGC29650.1 fimbrial protein [Escherichia sp. E1130]TLI74660.1 fimbrial protein [Escherichia sp. E1130]TLI84662.1 fimbrial protein [Escherichia sp. E2562]
MKIKIIATMIGTVIVSGVTFVNVAEAGTPSASLTVNSEITMGTCTTTLLDASNNSISTIAFGDVYISELYAKSKVKVFKIRFSGCAGIPGKSAKVKLTPRTPGCAGSGANTAAFANKSSNGPATNAAVEVWTSNIPEGSGSEPFNCFSANALTADLSTATMTKPYDYILSARMVIADNGPVANVTPGDFLSPATFTITYQ